MQKRLFYLILFFIAFQPTYSQNIDSLKQLIDTAKNPKVIRNAYLNLAIEDTNQTPYYYFKILLDQAKNNDTLYVKTCMEISKTYKLIGNVDSELLYLNKAIEFSKKKNLLDNLATAYYQVAFIYIKYNDYSKSIQYLDSALNIAQTLQDSDKLARNYNALGSVYYRMGHYELALTNYQKALEIAEKKNITQGLPSLYANIALIHEKQQDYDLALEYFKKAYDITHQLKVEQAYAPTAMNLAHIYNLVSQYDSAKKYINIALNIVEKTQNSYLMLHCLNILGDIYKNIDSLQLAVEKYSQALDLARKMNIQDVALSAELDIAEVYTKLADTLKSQVYLDKALNYAKEALDISLKINALPKENRAYALLSDIYAKKHNYQKAYEYSKKYIETSEELFNQDKLKAIEEMQAKYQTEKQQQQIVQQQLELEKKDAIVKKQKAIQWAMAVGGLMLLFILLLIYTGYRRKKRDNEIITKQNAQLQQANEEIKVQRDILQEQKNQIEEIHTQLTHSINYAERIQLAAMPSLDTLAEYFDNKYFLLYKPLHIVSGDFYWAKKIKDYIVFTVADCTGHGVPGAFVSMLGIALLNEITQNVDISSTKDVLELMRIRIKIALKQSGDWKDSKDGMDMALCAYNKEKREIEYSGANNPVLLVKKNSEIIKYQPVRNPVGVYFNEKSFESITFTVEEGDMLYLFSDGIVDQFGGEDNRKYTIKRFKDLLLKIHSLTCEEQKQAIDTEIMKWKGDHNQTDDITVMGIRF